MDFIDKE
jgi:DNA repair exonuclease SbcCD ATPase subunit